MAGASTARESALRHRGGRHRRPASPRHASWPEHFSLLARGTLDGFLSAYYDPPLRLGWFIETLAAKGKRATPRNKPVFLSDIKKEKRLQNIALIKQGRLSVTPLTREEFEVIVAKGRGKE